MEKTLWPYHRTFGYSMPVISKAGDTTSGMMLRESSLVRSSVLLILNASADRILSMARNWYRLSIESIWRFACTHRQWLSFIAFQWWNGRRFNLFITFGLWSGLEYISCFGEDQTVGSNEICTCTDFSLPCVHGGRKTSVMLPSKQCFGNVYRY